MHLRPMMSSDVPDLATMAAETFVKDELFRFITPHAAKYPSDFRYMMLHRYKQRFQTTGIHSLVCVSDQDDAPFPASSVAEDSVSFKSETPSQEQGERLLGYIFYQRKGPMSDPTVKAWHQDNTSWLSKLDMRFLKWEEWYNELTGRNRSMNMSNMREFQKVMSTDEPFARVPSYWFAKILGVATWAQKRGVGSLLMSWGKQRAAAERVPLCLDSSVVGEFFYHKEGMKIVHWLGYVVDESGEDLGRSLIWDPEGKFVRNVQNEDEAWITMNGHRRRVDAVWINP